jgi:hypothetical protein
MDKLSKRTFIGGAVTVFLGGTSGCVGYFSGGDERATTPLITFEVTEESGLVTFTHDKGDPVDTPKPSLSLAGPVEPIGSGSELVNEEDRTFTKGDKIEAILTDAAANGEEVRVNWQPSESADSSVLITHTLTKQ